MTLRIETSSDGTTITLRLIGLDHVTLVDLATVAFLIACEAQGVELRNCAPYIGEWMNGERGRD